MREELAVFATALSYCGGEELSCFLAATSACIFLIPLGSCDRFWIALLSISCPLQQLLCMLGFPETSRGDDCKRNVRSESFVVSVQDIYHRGFDGVVHLRYGLPAMVLHCSTHLGSVLPTIGLVVTRLLPPSGMLEA